MNIYQCEKCEKSFADKSSLNKHAKSMHEGIKYNCEKFEKIFYNQRNFKRHQEVTDSNVTIVAENLQVKLTYQIMKNLNME